MTEETLIRGPQRMLAERVECARHPWWAIKQGYVMTQDETPDGILLPVRPMPAKKYLEVVTRMMMTDPRGMLGKSRQLMMSWLVMWLLLWDAMYHDARHCIVQGKREDDVSARGWKGMLGRARFMREHLPPWLQPEVDKEDALIETYANGSALEAIPQGQDIVRSRVPSRMFMDELCFQETGERNWNAANPAAQWMWGVSTPNGHEFMYRQGEPNMRWDDWRKWPAYDPEVPDLHSYVNSRGIRLAFLFYTADEEERTQEAQEKRRRGYTKQRDFLREQMGHFGLPTGLPVYGDDFNPSAHVIDHYEVNPDAPIYRGWDFGYNGQACGFMQVNSEGQLVLFDLVFYQAVALQKVCQEVLRRQAIYLSKPAMTFRMDGSDFKPAALMQDWGDPSANSHHTDGETDVAILSRFGIKLRTIVTTGKKVSLVENVRTYLLPRSDGKPGLLIAKNSPEMDLVVAALEGGYHYAEPKEGQATKEVPHKDGFYDHIMDMIQYLIAGIRPPRIVSTADAKKDWWKDTEAGVGHSDYA